MKKKHLNILKFKKSENFSYKRKVIIKDLIFNTFIGLHEFEKNRKQIIKFNIEIYTNNKLQPDEQDLNSIINYEDIINKIETITNKKHYLLLETLAEDIFSNLFENKNIISIKLKIEKPEIIKNTSSVGIEVVKKRK